MCVFVCVFMLRADAKVLKTICVCESESFLGSDDGSIRELFRHGRGRGAVVGVSGAAARSSCRCCHIKLQQLHSKLSNGIEQDTRVQ